MGQPSLKVFFKKKSFFRVTFILVVRLYNRAMKEIDFKYDLLPLKNKLFRLALRITLDTAEAEDITQETLIRVWTKREELQELQSIEAYCMTICRNLALDAHAKKAAQNLSLDEQPIDAADNAPQPDERLEREEQIRQLREIIDRLPEKQRTALQLREMEEKTYKETAEIMGVTEENVKVLLFRARNVIKQLFKPKDKYGL